MSLEIDRSRSDLLKIRFVVALDEPDGPVSVVGSFNDWVAGMDELLPDDRGTRSVTIGLPYGCPLVFRYLAESGVWFDEPEADRITEQGSALDAIDPVTG